MRVLLDSNVIVDAFSAREGRNEDSITLVRKAITGEIEGCLCAKQITDIHYVLRKYADDATRKRVISLLLSNFTILPLTKEDLVAASELGGDFEDDVLIVVSGGHRVSLLATNDASGFSACPYACSPREALARIKN